MEYHILLVIQGYFLPKDNSTTMGSSTKRSISLSILASETLEKLMRIAGQDRSAVLEAAIFQFADKTEAEIVQAVREAIDAKRAGSPAGWRSLFWSALASEFGLEPNAFAYASNQPYGPRTFDRFNVVFLLPNIDGKETGFLTVHAFELVREDGQPGISMSWLHPLGESPFLAAQKTAAWIFEHRNGPTQR